jgi:hypothetical protein
MKNKRGSSDLRWLLAGVVLLALLFLTVSRARNAHATPSTTFWAPSTPYVQPYGVLHLTYDTYFGADAAYPIDTGLTMGVLPGKAFQAEVGFDFFYATVVGGEGVEAPIVLNAKVGAPEDVYFKGQPGWSFGVFGVGFEEDVNDQNALHFMLGKTFPKIGMPTLGVYYGLNEDLFRSADGEDERFGLMAGWSSPAIDVSLIDKLILCWDVQTGHNALGATGAGLYAYVTPAISVLTGPVFFFEEELQPGGSEWMWSVQLDVDLDLRSGSDAGTQ